MTQKRYSISGGGATGTNITLLTLANAAASPVVRPALYDLVLGCAAAPADVAGEFIIGRITALGTEGSGFTPVPLDPIHPAAECDAGVAVFSVEPTYTAGATVLDIPMNQRATFRWVAAPGSEFVAPATQNNGFGLRAAAMSSGTTAYKATMLFAE